MKRLFILIAASLVISIASCSEDNEQPTLFEGISGTWKIVRTNYQRCQYNDCSNNIQDAETLNLTFVVKADSVIYNSYVAVPESFDKFKLEAVSGDTLKLKNDAGIWDFVISERKTDSMTVTGIVLVPDDENLIYYDIFYLTR